MNTTAGPYTSPMIDRLRWFFRRHSVQYGTSWSLQVRGPLCLANRSPSKQGVIASAYLDLDSMRELRDTINGFLAEIEQQEAA